MQMRKKIMNYWSQKGQNRLIHRYRHWHDVEYGHGYSINISIKPYRRGRQIHRHRHNYNLLLIIRFNYAINVSYFQERPTAKQIQIVVISVYWRQMVHSVLAPMVMNCYQTKKHAMVRWVYMYSWFTHQNITRIVKVLFSYKTLNQ